MVKLAANWRRVARRAWSIRLNVLSAALGSVSVALSIVGADWIPLKPVCVLVIVVVCSVGAVVARLLDQHGWDDD